MHDLLQWYLSSDNFAPLGQGYAWDPGALWSNAIGDALIAFSFLSIPIAFTYFARQRRADLKYMWVPVVFAVFVILCGAGRLLAVWAVWHPIYRLEGALKLITGIVSFVAMLSIFWIMPKLMRLRTEDELRAEVTARTAELKQTNERLQAQITQCDSQEKLLREADQRKNEFLATLAHELRNPLAPIRQCLRIIEAPNVTDAKRQHARAVISRQVAHMALLLNDLLEVSQVSRGQVSLKLERIDLNSVIANAIETVAPLIESKEHKFSVHGLETSMSLRADPLRLSQAISNLLINAAKYTPTGGLISLTTQEVPDGLEISIEDSGIGFNEEQSSRMFDMFTQVSAPEHRTDGGLGIGLALVRGLIELHGGRVSATSAGAGLGAKFTLHLPKGIALRPSVAQTPAIEPAVGLEIPSTKGRVLIADDNRDAADTMSILLECEGYEVQVAYTGQEALLKGRSQSPHVVILDIGLPDMTGYEAARRLREEPWGQEALLIAVTGWGGSDDKTRAMAAGFDKHFTKPVDLTELERLIQRYLKVRDSR